MVFADSVNLARRLSSRNENDLMQDNFVGKKIHFDYDRGSFFSSQRTNSDISKSLLHLSSCSKASSHNYRECIALSRKLSDVNQLPKECRGYKEVLSNVARSKSENSIAFQGMGSSAAAAASARERGQENYAQIQRRFTNTRRFSKERS